MVAIPFKSLEKYTLQRRSTLLIRIQFQRHAVFLGKTMWQLEQIDCSFMTISRYFSGQIDCMLSVSTGFLKITTDMITYVNFGVL